MKIKIIGVAILLPLLLAAGCSGATPSPATVTVTQPAVTVTKTEPAVTITVTQPAATVTVTGPAVTTTVTATPAWIPNPFRGTMTVDYQATLNVGGHVSGQCAIKIDENGVVTGTFGSSYTGTVSGLVSLNGIFVAMGTLQGGTNPIVTTWFSTIKLDGKTLSTSGNWTTQYGPGTFTGTGTVSY